MDDQIPVRLHQPVRVVAGACVFLSTCKLIVRGVETSSQQGGGGNRGGQVVEGARGEAEANRHAKALLAAYVAGTLSEPFAVLVASHLQMTAVDRVRRAYGEGQLESRPPQAPAGLDEFGALLPLALRHYASRHLGALEWRTILPGIRRCRIAHGAWGEASFLRCRRSAAIPWHTHAGLEAALVLQGGFTDASGHYA